MGSVEGLFISPRAGGPVEVLARVRVDAGRGLEGDRYWAGVGTFSRWGGIGGEGRAVSLIEGEMLDDLWARLRLDLRHGEHRRNVVTRGVRLRELVGKQFRVGTALLRGTRVCTECKYLDRVAGAGVAEALHAHSGLRADVMESGLVSVGDAITVP